MVDRSECGGFLGITSRLFSEIVVFFIVMRLTRVFGVFFVLRLCVVCYICSSGMTLVVIVFFIVIC